MKTQGLSSDEAAKRLIKDGFNELPSSKPKNVLQIAVDVVKEPMFLLLISCGLLYSILGDYREGIILISATLVIILITFQQSRKTEEALEALKKMSSPRALVIRDNIEIRIPGREIVRGDLLVLHEGDRVAADAQILELNNLQVDESLLTGESLPILKEIETNNKDTRVNFLFSGSLIVQGRGIAEVKEIGIHTEFGKIGTSLENIVVDKTKLQVEMKKLIRNLFIIGIFISVAVILAYYFTRGNFIHAMLSGLAAAMAILPEEFPVVMTVFLALGAWRLSKKKVLTRKPSAIETLGSATVLCTDKTGTITLNKMEVVVLQTSEIVVNKPEFNQNKEKLESIIRSAYLACQETTSDPMEKAIIELYKASSIIGEYICIKEYTFSNEFPVMSRVYKSNDEVFVYIKGAPESVLGMCNLLHEEVSEQKRNLEILASKGYRVLGIATLKVSENDLPENQKDFKATFLGFLGLEDPIRPEVPNAIAECKEAGVRVVMITGDYPITAKSIAKQIGLDEDAEVMTGEELQLLSEDELQKRIKTIQIFARVIPEQKLRIVEALKANNEIVAMTGDGVNDAPALKSAHIGISMGMKGTDVAREASSLVLLDDNFASIVSAIRSGRRIYDNLQKAMSYILAIHIPIIGLTLLPAFFPFLPILLLPLHIIFMELIIDPVCSIAFESEQEEKSIMKRAPRNPNETFFGYKKIFASMIQGVLLLLVVISVYFLAIDKGHTEAEIRAIAFTSLILGNIALILTDLSKTRYVISVLLEKNISLMIILGAALSILFAVLVIPVLQNVFKLGSPRVVDFIPALIGPLIILSILEIYKYFKLKNSAI